MCSILYNNGGTISVGSIIMVGRLLGGRIIRQSRGLSHIDTCAFLCLRVALGDCA